MDPTIHFSRHFILHPLIRLLPRSISHDATYYSSSTANITTSCCCSSFSSVAFCSSPSQHRLLILLLISFPHLGSHKGTGSILLHLLLLGGRGVLPSCRGRTGCSTAVVLVIPLREEAVVSIEIETSQDGEWGWLKEIYVPSLLLVRGGFRTPRSLATGFGAAQVLCHCL